MRSLVLILFALTCWLPVIAQGKQAPELNDGKQIEVKGVLHLVRRGNRSFIMLKTNGAFIAVYNYGDGKVERRRVNEIGVIEDGQNVELKKHTGQIATVSGKLQIEFSSPYYYNGTLIDAAAIKLPDGKVLAPIKTELMEPSVELKQYRAEIIFTPALSEPYRYKIWDMQGKSLKADKNYILCGMNGPGDVMNCFCGDDFNLSNIGIMRNGTFKTTLPNQDSIYSDMRMAQFSIPEELKGSVSRVIECTRLKPKIK